MRSNKQLFHLTRFQNNNVQFTSRMYVFLHIFNKTTVITLERIAQGTPIFLISLIFFRANILYLYLPRSLYLQHYIYAQRTHILTTVLPSADVNLCNLWERETKRNDIRDCYFFCLRCDATSHYCTKACIKFADYIGGFVLYFRGRRVSFILNPNFWLILIFIT